MDLGILVQNPGVIFGSYPLPPSPALSLEPACDT